MKANQVRIIAGEFRRRLLSFPDATGLRPTPDRVRETVFNWLGQNLHGLSCLDAFAGSGALGFEAASRGAMRVLLLEKESRALAALRRNVEDLQCAQVEIQTADALHYLATPGEAFDVIFLDPPFAADLMTRALRLAVGHLRPEGRIYAETPAFLPEETLTTLGLKRSRQGKAGHSHYCLLELA